ncbi:DUF6776 family protein [Thermomonas sp. HDW16]|uniref:DUF6776 family protein n=1 Tax=Thermomonas sp. HDW16 TaxID=2714945 RepID=UPI0014088F27|nr:DUF6776 family protein [Thermomonas sp. HDW16]QIL19791.1 hypothetical protein G7079_03070 [Thermomonas sp. HDW16]
MAFALLVLAALAFGGWGLWRAFGPQPANARDTLRTQASRIDILEQEVATLKRSDQISRQANTDLQGTLAERDEEIASLRADIAFYERFVGSTAQRHGLSVHELKLQPQRDPQLWHFVATLTQNLNRGAVNRGRLLLMVEASNGGRMQKLGWGELRQQPNAPGIEYSFKYFQQIEGDLVLPVGVKPVRVIARLVPAAGSPMEQSFTWGDATVGAPANR